MFSQVQEMINDLQQEIDLVLLDVYMQQDSGFDFLLIICELGCVIDVIMIILVVDVVMVQIVMYYGVVDYLIKFFQFLCFEEVFIIWWEKCKLIIGQFYYEQVDVDCLLYGGVLEVSDVCKLFKGLIV